MKNSSDKFTLGVLGGGQLGRMLLRSAIDLDIDVTIMDADPHSPSASRTNQFFIGDIQSEKDILTFAKNVDLLTIEIENINVSALEQVEKMGIPVYPQPKVIQLIQDKSLQKTFYQNNNIPTSPFIIAKDKKCAQEILIKKYQEKPGAPSLKYVNKIAKGGYDGRGVQIINNKNDVDKVFDAPSIIENFIPFEKELSVIVARNKKGDVKAYPVTEQQFNPHVNLVEYLLFPAQISSQIAQKAEEIAINLIEKLNMVGLLAVELFLTSNECLYVNEIAPRTHNSGHHTIESAITSQFEQQLRALLNMPLGSTKVLFPAVMLNVLGEKDYHGLAKYPQRHQLLEMEGVHLHLYGKKETKPYRKMGHITIIEENEFMRNEKVAWIQKNFKVIS